MYIVQMINPCVEYLIKHVKIYRQSNKVCKYISSDNHSKKHLVKHINT